MVPRGPGSILAVLTLIGVLVLLNTSQFSQFCGSSNNGSSGAAATYHVAPTAHVTFIIPTKGRDTLNRTLESLLSQTHTDWAAVVVDDGVGVQHIEDQRIRVIKIPQVGTSNHAAQLRNFGITQADTEWVAFVDDDDTVSDMYVQLLKEELALTPLLDCVIFRMTARPGHLLPGPNATDFVKAGVGISFALKRQLFVVEGFMFVPGQFEDFTLLNTLRKHQKKMLISAHTAYFVKSVPAPSNVSAVRALIN